MVGSVQPCVNMAISGFDEEAGGRRAHASIAWHGSRIIIASWRTCSLFFISEVLQMMSDGEPQAGLRCERDQASSSAASWHNVIRTFLRPIGSPL